MNRKLLIQIWILFGILLANFLAQILYFYHLYYAPQHPFPSPRSSLIMSTVFAVFLVSYYLFITKHKAGWYMMAAFLAVEFLFYLWNTVSSGLRPEFGWFFHLQERDPILWIVFAVGYLSFFASGYFLFLLFYDRRDF
jgi:hypothetical protein